MELRIRQIQVRNNLPNLMEPRRHGSVALRMLVSARTERFAAPESEATHVMPATPDKDAPYGSHFFSRQFFGAKISTKVPNANPVVSRSLE